MQLASVKSQLYSRVTTVILVLLGGNVLLTPQGMLIANNISPLGGQMDVPSKDIWAFHPPALLRQEDGQSKHPAWTASLSTWDMWTLHIC
jgi:hypothetical protein